VTFAGCVKKARGNGNLSPGDDIAAGNINTKRSSSSFGKFHHENFF
jgi:hypothetical protein